MNKARSLYDNNQYWKKELKRVGYWSRVNRRNLILQHQAYTNELHQQLNQTSKYFTSVIIELQQHSSKLTDEFFYSINKRDQILKFCENIIKENLDLKNESKAKPPFHENPVHNPTPKMDHPVHEILVQHEDPFLEPIPIIDNPVHEKLVQHGNPVHDPISKIDHPVQENLVQQSIDKPPFKKRKTESPIMEPQIMEQQFKFNQPFHDNPQETSFTSSAHKRKRVLVTYTKRKRKKLK